MLNLLLQENFTTLKNDQLIESQYCFIIILATKELFKLFRLFKKLRQTFINKKRKLLRVFFYDINYEMRYEIAPSTEQSNLRLV